MRIAVVEILDRDGHARQTVPVAHWPVTVGRAVDCDVVLDDPHVAARHATLDEVNGELILQVGESVNGAEWRGTRVRAGASAPLPQGEPIQIGTTRLRIRRAADVLAPERTLVPEPAASRVPLPLLVTGLAAWELGDQWLRTDPGGRFTDYLEIAVFLVLALVIWCGVWALASKLFRHRFEFWPHTRIATSYMLVSSVLGFALPVLAFMSGWTLLSRVAGFAVGAVACAMVVAHLARIVPGRRRALGVGMAALFATGVAVILARNYQAQDRLFSELYVSTLAPPALRLASPVPPAQFLEEARALKAVLDAHIKDDDPDRLDLLDLDSAAKTR